MTLIDSSGWIEIIRDGARAGQFRQCIAQAEGLLVPTLVLYEVYRVVEREASMADADRVAAHLRSYELVDLDDIIALEAAKLGRRHRLAMGDAIVLATSWVRGARLVTGDADFAGLPDVQHIVITEEA
jgi:predicted nucleic acid-binding protein